MGGVGRARRLPGDRSRPPGEPRRQQRSVGERLAHLTSVTATGGMPLSSPIVSVGPLLVKVTCVDDAGGGEPSLLV